MTRSEWKAAARARLGGGIFKDQWLMGVVFCLVVSAIVGAAGSILPGVGALVVTGPMLYAQKYAFLAQAREAGLISLKGHRVLGGMRASIYNAMPEAGVQALADFMKDFQQRNG